MMTEVCGATSRIMMEVCRATSSMMMLRDTTKSNWSILSGNFNLCGKEIVHDAAKVTT